MGLTDKEIEELREIFQLVDTDGGGSIDGDELHALLDTLGVKTTEGEVERMIAEIDIDGNGEIDFDEFLEVMQNKVGIHYQPRQILDAFQYFEDGQAKDWISRESLERAMCIFAHERIPQARANELLNQISFNDEGLVNYKKLVLSLMEVDEDSI